MIRVTVELVHFGDESKKEKIGEMSIVNTTENKRWPDYGGYTYSIYSNATGKGNFLSNGRGEVKNHKRSDGVWKLIHMALECEGMRK